MPVVRCREVASGILMRLVVPSNDRPQPYFPALFQTAFLIVPLFPFPEISVMALPLLSLNAYAATSPGTGGWVLVGPLAEMGREVVALPAPSHARAVMLCVPFAT